MPEQEEVSGFCLLLATIQVFQNVAERAFDFIGNYEISKCRILQNVGMFTASETGHSRNRSEFTLCPALQTSAQHAAKVGLEPS